jgi:putative peptidoglycan lipid II flippase
VTGSKPQGNPDELGDGANIGDVSEAVSEAAREIDAADLTVARPQSATAGLLKSSALMATGTMVSRITGVGRDIALTAALGFFVVADAFSLGNTLPNIVYILVVGGALNAVFIPQLVRHMKDDSDGGNAYADRLLTLVISALLIVSVAAVVLAPFIVRLYATAQYSDSQRELAIAFAQFCLPQILFYGAYTVFSQVLNARGRFGAPMFAPIINNIIAIAVFLGFLVVAGPTAASQGTLTSGQIAWLGIGSTIGVAAQALILMPVLWRSGYVWHPRFDWRGTGLRKTGSLAFWTIGLVLVNQLGYIVITRLATLANVLAENNNLVPAGLTTYQKAHLIFILPHSVITVSLVTALLPRISRAAHDGDFKAVGHGLASSARLAASIVIPISAIMFVLAPRLTRLMFGFGAATSASASYTGYVVMAFLIGIIPFTLFYILLRGWYAMEDTRTPFILTVVFNVLMLAIMVPAFYATTDSAKVVALAASYSIAYWVILVIATWLLSRRLGGLEVGQTVATMGKLLIAGIAAAAVTFAVVSISTRFIPEAGRWGLLVDLLIGSVFGALAFALVALALRIAEVRDAINLVRRRLGGAIS